MSKEEKHAIRAFLASKEARRQEQLDRCFARAVADAERIIEMVRDRYAPRRIYQWGSLLERRKFQEISDIDIAVEGLSSPEEIFAVYGEAEKLTRFPLDIVELEKIHPAHARSIRERGRLVYERTE